MAIRQAMTAEELWLLADVPGKRFELAHGELVDVAGGGLVHNLIIGLLFRLLDETVRRHDLGLIFTDGTGFVLRRSPDIVRLSDVAFLSWQRIPKEGIPEGFWPGSPDLAADIVSPGDRADEVHDKVRDELAAGTSLVWVLWPRHRSVAVYEQGGRTRELGPDDDLDGGHLLPGFQVRVSELFSVRRKR